MQVNQMAILCGGFGTRLRPLTYDIPKSMALIEDKPFLEVQILFYKKQGLRRFVLCSGNLHEHIVEHFGDGKEFGVDIVHSVEDEPLGTGGALLEASQHLDERFFVAYGDSLLPIQIAPMLRMMVENHALGVLTAYDNHERVAQNNLHVAENGEVLAYDKEVETKEMNAVEGGVSLLHLSVLELATERRFSLETDIFPKLINKGRLFGLLTSQRFYDIGTPDGLELGRRMLNDLG
jgi:NDP-sugar pyrophosphorylase family protein